MCPATAGVDSLGGIRQRGRDVLAATRNRCALRHYVPDEGEASVYQAGQGASSRGEGS
jgi:hypothetical protein